ncbi:zinc finger protein 511 isoform X2 [Excalfactoria chinensis]|uniref:zinc finger protein 511 isoform X2 n=1 Tax=Excalfactoria chinensis TaxID=46218 RepID=UPI003B3BE836
MLPSVLRRRLRERPPLPPVPPPASAPPRPPFAFSPRRLRLDPQHPLLEVFDTLEGYEHHYNVLHRNVCSFCRRSFPSGHLLDIHISEWHDSLFQIMAEKQNMYKCLVEGCAEKFKSSKDRKDHLVTAHLYPADFRFDRPKKVKSGNKHVSCATDDGSMLMDVSVETSEQLQTDHMEVPMESIEVPQPAASPSVLEKRLYKSRIPSTVCFGQGATRGFKGPRKKV